MPSTSVCSRSARRRSPSARRRSLPSRQRSRPRPRRLARPPRRRLAASPRRRRQPARPPCPHGWSTSTSMSVSRTLVAKRRRQPQKLSVRHSGRARRRSAAVRRQSVVARPSRNMRRTDAARRTGSVAGRLSEGGQTRLILMSTSKTPQRTGSSTSRVRTNRMPQVQSPLQ